MSDHLPECRYVVFQQQGQIPEAVIPMGCICAALSACEARLEDEWLNRYNAAEQRGYDAGFRNGVQAARDAVAEVDHIGYYAEEVRDAALAAIDALRDEP